MIMRPRLLIHAMLLAAFAVLYHAPAARAGTQPAPAAPAAMTRADIEAVYKLDATMHQLPYEQYLAAYDTVFHPDLRVRNVINITVPPQPPMQMSDTPSLTDYKDGALKTFQGLQGATVSNTITALTIAPDGQSATVTDSSTVQNAHDPEMADHAYMNMKAVCQDKVVMGAGGTPQILNSDCVLDIEIVQEQEL